MSGTAHTGPGGWVCVCVWGGGGGPGGGLGGHEDWQRIG